MNAPAARTESQLILEGIVTTANADGSVNVAPMGPVVDRELNELRLRPFQTSTTYQNLARHGNGVFHVTDDVCLLAAAAIGKHVSPEMETVETLDGVEGHIISGACRWFAFKVIDLDDSNDRTEISCQVVKRADVRPFLGWNRAMHAVLEAAILATRIGLLPLEEIREQLAPLSTIVDKTASQHERDAFAMIIKHVNESQ